MRGGASKVMERSASKGMAPVQGTGRGTRAGADPGNELGGNHGFQIRLYDVPVALIRAWLRYRGRGTRAGADPGHES